MELKCLKVKENLSLLFLICSLLPQEAFDGKENNDFHDREESNLDWAGL